MGSEESSPEFRKHGVAFDRAATIFLDPRAISELDEEESRNEDRWITISLDRTGALLVVCHTFHEQKRNNAGIRLISARKATKNEAKYYEKE